MDGVVQFQGAEGMERAPAPGPDASRVLLAGRPLEPAQRDRVLGALVHRVLLELRAVAALLACETDVYAGHAAVALTYACLAEASPLSVREARHRIDELLSWPLLRDDLRAGRTRRVPDLRRERGAPLGLLAAGPGALLCIPFRPLESAAGALIVARAPDELDAAQERLEEIAALATPVVLAALDPEVLPLDAEVARFLAFMAGREPWERPADYAPDRALCESVGVEILRRHVALPLVRNPRGALRMVVADPFDPIALDDLIFASGSEIAEVLVGPAGDLRAILDGLGPASSPIENLLSELASDGEPAEAAGPPETAELEADPLPADHPARRTWERFMGAAGPDDPVPVVRFLEELLREAIAAHADEVHVEPTALVTRIRFRVDGAIRDHAEVPRRVHNSLLARAKIVANLDIAERKVPQDGLFRLAETMPGNPAWVRASVLPTAEGERLCLTLCRPDAGPAKLEEIGLSPASLDRLRGLLRRPRGLVFFVGPGQSGRTTLAYACLRELASPKRVVLTAEIAVERELPGVHQSVIVPAHGMYAGAAFRALLRQAPDAVFLCTTSDAESARLLLDAGRERCLALSTLHVGDAASAVLRLQDMGMEPYLLAEALSGVVAVRLARRLCACATTRPARDEERVLLEAPAGTSLRVPAGCAECRGTGYRGRVGIQEVLVADEGVRDAIRCGERGETVRAAAARGGMRTLWEDARDKVLAGQTSLAEALALGVRQGR